MEKREMAGDYEILQAVRLGGKEVLLGYNPKDGCAPYMTSYRAVNFLGDYTYQTFLLLLQRNGYVIKSGPNRKYTAVRPPGAKRFIRLDSLSEGYTEEAIKQRLMGQRSGVTQKLKQPAYHTKHYRVKGKLSRYPKRKITGFLALYFRYVYLLRGARRAKPSYRAAFPIRKEVIRLERYHKQFQYLMAQNITTPAQLAAQISKLEAEIAKLTE